MKLRRSGVIQITVTKLWNVKYEIWGDVNVCALQSSTLRVKFKYKS